MEQKTEVMQKVQIKLGASVYQDHAFSKWPKLPREIDAVSFPEMVFLGCWDGTGWDCQAPKFGAKGSYGNGRLYVRGIDNVEVLDASTPVTEQPAPAEVPEVKVEQNTEASQAVKFRKKPVEIEAIQWNGTKFDTTPPQWFCDAMYAFGKPGFIMRFDNNIIIETLEGQMTAAPGDWIIRGVKGEIYPCKPDIFELTYERAAFKAQPAPTEAANVSANVSAMSVQGLCNSAQVEDSARLDADMLALLIREAGILNERGMAWLLNGESISLNLTNLLAIANMIEDRASAETGGVKS